MIKYLVCVDDRFSLMIQSPKYKEEQLVVLFKLHELDELVGLSDLKAHMQALTDIDPDWESVLAFFSLENPRHEQFQKALIAWAQQTSRRPRLSAEAIEKSIQSLLPMAW